MWIHDCWHALQVARLACRGSSLRYSYFDHDRARRREFSFQHHSEGIVQREFQRSLAGPHLHHRYRRARRVNRFGHDEKSQPGGNPTFQRFGDCNLSTLSHQRPATVRGRAIENDLVLVRSPAGKLLILCQILREWFGVGGTRQNECKQPRPSRNGERVVLAGVLCTRLEPESLLIGGLKICPCCRQTMRPLNLMSHSRDGDYSPPPVQIRTCAVTHTAPTLSVGRESVAPATGA